MVKSIKRLIKQQTLDFIKHMRYTLKRNHNKKENKTVKVSKKQASNKTLKVSIRLGQAIIGMFILGGASQGFSRFLANMSEQQKLGAAIIITVVLAVLYLLMQDKAKQL